MKNTYQTMIQDYYDLSIDRKNLLADIKFGILSNPYIDTLDFFEIVFEEGIPWELFLEYINYDRLPYLSGIDEKCLDDKYLIKTIESKGVIYCEKPATEYDDDYDEDIKQQTK